VCALKFSPTTIDNAGALREKIRLAVEFLVNVSSLEFSKGFFTKNLFNATTLLWQRGIKAGKRRN
jgi:hypothetical protein